MINQAFHQARTMLFSLFGDIKALHPSHRYLIWNRVHYLLSWMWPNNSLCWLYPSILLLAKYQFNHHAMQGQRQEITTFSSGPYINSRFRRYFEHIQTFNQQMDSIVSHIFCSQLGQRFPGWRNHCQDAQRIQQHHTSDPKWNIEGDTAEVDPSSTHTLLDKSDPQPALCPLCSQPRPSLTHLFWSCNHISIFWDQVLSFKLGITSIHIPKDPQLLIFGYWTPYLLPKMTKEHFWHKDWILICLLTAWRTILKQWTSSHPTITLLKRELTTLMYREKAS